MINLNINENQFVLSSYPNALKSISTLLSILLAAFALPLIIHDPQISPPLMVSLLFLFIFILGKIIKEFQTVIISPNNELFFRRGFYRKTFLWKDLAICFIEKNNNLLRKESLNFYCIAKGLGGRPNKFILSEFTIDKDSIERINSIESEIHNFLETIRYETNDDLTNYQNKIQSKFRKIISWTEAFFFPIHKLFTYFFLKIGNPIFSFFISWIPVLILILLLNSLSVFFPKNNPGLNLYIDGILELYGLTIEFLIFLPIGIIMYFIYKYYYLNGKNILYHMAFFLFVSYPIITPIVIYFCAAMIHLIKENREFDFFAFWDLILNKKFILTEDTFIGIIQYCVPQFFNWNVSIFAIMNYLFRIFFNIYIPFYALHEYFELGNGRFALKEKFYAINFWNIKNI